MTTRAAPAGLSRTRRAKAVEHGRHAALDVAGAAAVEPAVLDAGRERVDGHAVGGHRVLMHLQDEGAAGAGRLVPGEDVVASGRDGLPLRADAEVAEEVFEVGGDAVLEKVGAVEVAAHGVDARQGDQIAQETGGFVHEGTNIV